MFHSPDHKISVVNTLSNEEVAKLASFSAKAFVDSKSFGFCWMIDIFGKYEVSAEIYDTFMRAWITAALECGSVIVNESRTGFRCLYGPGQVFPFTDKNNKAGRSAHLDELFKTVNEDMFYDRQAEWAKLSLEVYGRDVEALKGYMLVVDPKHQHKGIGKALQSYTENMAAAAGVPVIFPCEPWNLDMYKRRGYMVLGEWSMKKEDGSEGVKLFWLRRDS